MLHELTNIADRGRVVGTFKLELFEARLLRSGRDLVALKPFDVIRFNNLGTNTGMALAEDLLIGAGGTVFSNANAYVGSGDSSTAVSAAHTDLQAAVNKLRVAMDATFPSRSGQITTFKSTFATGQANWLWNEMAVFNASSAGTMLCRALVGSPFTKTSSLSIAATYTWTVA